MSLYDYIFLKKETLLLKEKDLKQIKEDVVCGFTQTFKDAYCHEYYITKNGELFCTKQIFNEIEKPKIIYFHGHINF